MHYTTDNAIHQSFATTGRAVSFEKNGCLALVPVRLLSEPLLRIAVPDAQQSSNQRQGKRR
jgi:hypothetical protein